MMKKIIRESSYGLTINCRTEHSRQSAVVGGTVEVWC